MTQPDIRVQLHSAPPCFVRSPRNLPCLRAEGHTGRCAYYWRHTVPGKVREVWAAGTCQVCYGVTAPTEGAVCRKCGPS